MLIKSCYDNTAVYYFSKLFIMKKICPFIISILTLMACANEYKNTNDTVQAKFDKKQTKIEKNIAEQANQDRPQLEVPAVDYTSPSGKSKSEQ